MLKNTFIHIPGIGEKTEKTFWENGFSNWQSALSNKEKLLPSKAQTVCSWIKKSLDHYDKKAFGFFADHLPSSQLWRLFPDLKDGCAYIDIETTGLDMTHDEITTIALYDGNSVKTYVNGLNLTDFVKDIKAYDLIVTYNGKTFDIPFIESFFNVTIGQPHIDLRYILASLGFKGGLKRCEKALGIGRGDLDGVDGFFAVLLWQEYQNNRNQKALDTLLAYNIEDVVNLETLMIKSFNLKIDGLPSPFFKEFSMAEPQTGPDHGYIPDLQTVERIRYQTERIQDNATAGRMTFNPIWK